MCVVATDFFDEFISQNNLLDVVRSAPADDRIAEAFQRAALPPRLVGDLRALAEEARTPLAVRSSSLLEDAMHHPFAGVYASLLLPNESWETDIRFQELCTAIKYVFASVFFKKARMYMKTMDILDKDEKMAVIIEELVGRKYGNIYYPTISGVGKSYDYYPNGACKPNDGVANLALGLGKAVVDGGSSYRFCPMHPKIPKHSTLKELPDAT